MWKGYKLTLLAGLGFLLGSTGALAAQPDDQDGQKKAQIQNDGENDQNQLQHKNRNRLQHKNQNQLQQKNQPRVQQKNENQLEQKSQLRVQQKNEDQLQQKNQLRVQQKNRVRTQQKSQLNGEDSSEQNKIQKKAQKRVKTQKKLSFVDRNGDGIHDGKEYRFRKNKNSSNGAKKNRQRWLKRRGGQGHNKPQTGPSSIH